MKQREVRKFSLVIFSLLAIEHRHLKLVVPLERMLNEGNKRKIHAYGNK